MLKRSTSITLGIIVLVIILLAGWWGISRSDKSGFGGGGLGHGRAPLGGGSRLDGAEDHHGFEPEHFSTHEGLGGGGRGGGGGGGRRR